MSSNEISTAGEAKRLVIEAETPNEWTADGMDLQYFNIRAVDSKGRQVPFYDEELSVDVAGEATFVAMDNGDHYTDELFAGVTTKRMQQGYMQVILRSTRQKGKVTLGVKTPTMKASVKLQTR